MMLSELTNEQIEQRLEWVEKIIAEEKDVKNLPYHNAMYQKMIDELADRDLAGK